MSLGLGDGHGSTGTGNQAEEPSLCFCGELLSHIGTTQVDYLYDGQDGVITDANGLYFMRARYYDPTIGRFLSEDPAKSGLNLYTYSNNNPMLFIDPLGLDAIAMNQTTGVLGEGHMSSFVQDEDGNWYFFYWGDTVSVTKVDDASIMSDSESINQWLRDMGLIKKDSHPDYDGFVYIPGDFTASLDYYWGLEKIYKKDVSTGKTGLFVPNRNYNVATRNCTMETMNGLMLGILSDGDGTSVGDYYLGIYNIGVQPNNNLYGLQMAFMNSAYTYSGFTTQASANLQNAQSYLSGMYGDYSDPTGKYSQVQVNAMQSIIKMMNKLVP